MAKHIDVIALFAIVLGLLAVSHAREVRIVQPVRVADFRVQNPIGPSAPLTRLCPLVDGLLRHVR